MCVGPFGLVDKSPPPVPKTEKLQNLSGNDEKKKAQNKSKKSAKHSQNKKKIELEEDCDDSGGGGGGGGGGQVVAEDVTIEIPAWDDFYGFSSNQNPQSMNYGGFGFNTGNPSPIDASLFGGYNPLA